MTIPPNPPNLPTSPAAAITRLVGATRREFDLHLEAALPHRAEGEDLVIDAMRYAALAPGKRIRPLLVLLAGRSLGQRKSRLFDAACSLEMIHAASLVLDDLPCMDDAHMRRGQPTVHVRFGQDVAVLAAIALLSQAYGTLARTPGVSAANRNRLVGVLSTAVGSSGLVAGQLRDLRPRESRAPASDIATTNQLKTGSLFYAAFEMAGIVANAPPAALDAMRLCANEIGHAFQLRDDLQDKHSVAVTGKDAHQDHGKPTVVSLFGDGHAKAQLQAHVHKAAMHWKTVCPDDATLPCLLGALAGTRVDPASAGDTLRGRAAARVAA